LAELVVKPMDLGDGVSAKNGLIPFNSTVLFAGSVSRPVVLPWTFLMSFLLLQTTLPAIGLAGIGAFLAFRRKDDRRGEYIATAIWFLLPILLAIGLGTTLYDNGRHYLFLWTAGLLFAAVAIEWVLALPLPKGISLGLAAAALLPGLLGIIRLHPYEYVYFNELVGGVRGAFRRYDLDYWATSYREAMGYVNREASPGPGLPWRLPGNSLTTTPVGTFIWRRSRAIQRGFPSPSSGSPSLGQIGTWTSIRTHR
jgi:hypothetical protein